jgi:hypothetical protein
VLVNDTPSSDGTLWISAEVIPALYDSSGTFIARLEPTPVGNRWKLQGMGGFIEWITQSDGTLSFVFFPDTVIQTTPSDFNALQLWILMGGIILAVMVLAIIIAKKVR